MEVPQGQWYYYHSDGRGSVTKVTRQDKSVANRYDYDDFGNFRSKSEAVPNPYGFTGRETDVPGLVYYRARYYDSEAGRFLTRDPGGMAGGANRYAYAGSNPVSYTDPAGRWRARSITGNIWIPPPGEYDKGCDWWEWLLDPMGCTVSELNDVARLHGATGVYCIMECITRNPATDSCKILCGGFLGACIGGVLPACFGALAFCVACLGLVFMACVNYVYVEMVAEGGPCPF